MSCRVSYPGLILTEYIPSSPFLLLHGLFLLVRHLQFLVILPSILKINIAITTVGYGEITPRSFLGRLITVPILVFGLLLITLPSFVLGREFSHVWERMSRDRVSFNPNFIPSSSHTHTTPPSFFSKGKRRYWFGTTH